MPFRARSRKGGEHERVHSETNGGSADGCLLALAGLAAGRADLGVRAPIAPVALWQNRSRNTGRTHEIPVAQFSRTSKAPVVGAHRSRRARRLRGAILSPARARGS